MRQKFLDTAVLVRRQACQHVLQHEVQRIVSCVNGGRPIAFGGATAVTKASNSRREQKLNLVKKFRLAGAPLAQVQAKVLLLHDDTVSADRGSRLANLRGVLSTFPSADNAND